MMKKTLLSALLGTALIGGAPALYAQGGYGQGQQGQPPGAQQQQSQNFSDQDLKTYADLQNDIRDIRVEYQEKIQSAPSEDDARELQQEAQEEMVDVIQESPIDVDTFNAIGQAYNTDSEVRNRIVNLMQEP